ncbi:MAG: hypothetical protein M3Y72_24465, partial [Acidobacteriota bacterium]|nr:hypothetical protein [Acidobacteriota bacterium]
MNSELLGYRTNGTASELVLSPDLFEKLHLGSPLHGPSRFSRSDRFQVGPTFAGKWVQIKVAES